MRCLVVLCHTESTFLLVIVTVVCVNKDDLSSYRSGWCIATGIIQCFLSMSSTYIVMLFMYLLCK